MYIIQHHKYNLVIEFMIQNHKCLADLNQWKNPIGFVC